MKNLITMLLFYWDRNQNFLRTSHILDNVFYYSFLSFLLSDFFFLVEIMINTEFILKLFEPFHLIVDLLVLGVAFRKISFILFFSTAIIVICNLANIFLLSKRSVFPLSISFYFNGWSSSYDVFGDADFIWFIKYWYKDSSAHSLIRKLILNDVLCNNKQSLDWIILLSTEWELHFPELPSLSYPK